MKAVTGQLHLLHARHIAVVAASSPRHYWHMSSMHKSLSKVAVGAIKRS